MYRKNTISCYIYCPLPVKVFRIVYCVPFRECDAEEFEEICSQFVATVKEAAPQMLQKAKIHLLLHLVYCMVEFGPCSGFNTERYIF